MKKNKEVAAAEAVVAKAKQEYDEAKAVLAGKETALSKAQVELRNARVQADAELPQCQMIIKDFHGRERDMSAVVILRKTPSGQLVVRNVGDQDGGTYRFKWNKWHEEYVQAEKRQLYSDRRKLRDVPPEFLP